MRFCKAGMIGTKSCRIIWAVMYGYTPIASTEKFETVPPESILSRLNNVPPAPPPERILAIASRFAPGTGTCAARRKITRRPIVTNSLRRISFAVHRKRQADRFIFLAPSLLQPLRDRLNLKSLEIQDLNAAASRLNFGFGACAHTVGAHLQRNFHFPAAQDNHRIFRVAQQARHR